MSKIQLKYNLKKISIENILLITTFSILLWAGHANLMSHKLAHDFPMGYMASDAFQHQTRAEGLKELGNYRYEAFYNMAGLKDVVGFYMPVLYHIGVIFSNISGLEVYDGVYTLLFILSCLAALIMYFIIKKFNKTVAILSLPLTIFIFYQGTYIGFTWGHWPSICAQFFLIAMFWSITFLSDDGIKGIYLITAIFLSAVILTHTSEGIYAVIFLGFYILLELLRKKFNFAELKTEFKKIIFTGIISLILCFYYLIIFKASWYNLHAKSYSLNASGPLWEGTPGFYISYFGILLIFILLGLVISLFFLKKDNYIAIYLGIFMLLGGYANYIGWSLRAFTLRFFWPIYLSVFFGLSIYTIIVFIFKRFKLIYALLFYLTFIILFLGVVTIPYIPHYTKMSGSIMDGYHWQAIEWIRDNTPQDSKIYFFYGDIYDQDALLRNSKRLHFLVVPEDYIKSLNNMTVKRYYHTEVPADTGGGLIFRKKFLSYGLRTLDSQQYKGGFIDVCIADYYVFDKFAGIPQLAQYNLIIRSMFLKTGWMREVFSNDLVSILVNTKPGEECIPMEGVKIGQ